MCIVGISAVIVVIGVLCIVLFGSVVSDLVIIISVVLLI